MSTFWKWIINIIATLLGLVPVALFGICLYSIYGDASDIAWIVEIQSQLEKIFNVNWEVSSITATLGVSFVYWAAYAKIVGIIKNASFRKWVKARLGDNVKDQYSAFKKTKYDLMNTVTKKTKDNVK